MIGLSKDEILGVARAEVEARGGTWTDKEVRVSPGLRQATVLVGANRRGGQIRIRVDRLSGEVASYWKAVR